MNKIYICKYSTGAWETYSVVTVFATTDKEKAEKWVEKFNRITKDSTIGDFYKSKYYEKEEPHWVRRWYQYTDFNEAYFKEIESR